MKMEQVLCLYHIKKNERPTMAISNCLFSPTSENPCGFSVWFVLAKLTAKPRNYS